MPLAPAELLAPGEQFRVALDALGLGDAVLAAPVVLRRPGLAAKIRKLRHAPAGVPPEEDDYRKLINGSGEVVGRLLGLRRLKELGPAIYIDAARYAAQRALTAPSQSRLVYEVFYAYLLPQFEGIDDERAARLFDMVCAQLDPPEQAEARRTIEDVLGVDLPA